MRGWLLGLYVFACGLLIPEFPYRLRWPEFLFPCLLLAALPDLWRARHWGRWEKACAVFLLTRALAGHGGAELVGNLYLVLVALTVTALGRHERFLLAGFRWLGLLSAAAGLLGWGLTTVGGLDNPLARSASWPYPYFGAVGRAQAFTGHPNMLASLLVVCLLLNPRPRERVLLGLGLLATLSKSVLLVGVTLLWVRGRRLTALVLLAAFVALTHWLWIPSGALARHGYVPAGQAVPSPTVYLVLKQWAVRAFAEQPLRGVGGLNLYLLRQPGYPLVQPYDPHCTYTGVAAEHGLLGLLGLAALVWGLRGQRHPLLVFFCLEALVTDELNFRHVWIVLGWLLARQEKSPP